jgi:hypothetical protein
MTYDRKDTDTAAGITYDREFYRCAGCGTWVTVETPQKDES